MSITSVIIIAVSSAALGMVIFAYIDSWLSKNSEIEPSPADRLEHPKLVGETIQQLQALDGVPLDHYIALYYATSIVVTAISLAERNRAVEAGNVVGFRGDIIKGAWKELNRQPKIHRHRRVTVLSNGKVTQ